MSGFCFAAIAVKEKVGGQRATSGRIDDLDFFIGDEALSPAAANYSVKVRTF